MVHSLIKRRLRSKMSSVAVVPGDFDHDGKTDLVAAGYHSGLWIRVLPILESGTTLIDKDSSGFEHTSYATDVDGDGKANWLLLLTKPLNIYRWNGESFDEKIGEIAQYVYLEHRSRYSNP